MVESLSINQTLGARLLHMSCMQTIFYYSQRQQGMKLLLSMTALINIVVGQGKWCGGGWWQWRPAAAKSWKSSKNVEIAMGGAAYIPNLQGWLQCLLMWRLTCAAMACQACHGLLGNGMGCNGHAKACHGLPRQCQGMPTSQVSLFFKDIPLNLPPSEP